MPRVKNVHAAKEPQQSQQPLTYREEKILNGTIVPKDANEILAARRHQNELLGRRRRPH